MSHHVRYLRISITTSRPIISAMTGKRKRHRPQKPDVTPCKRVRYDVAAITYDEVTHPTLSLYYPRISTLRHHILSKLPASSKKRRRRILAVKRNTATKVCTSKVQSSQGSEFTVDDALGTLLDRTLVCSRDDEYKLDAQDQDREQDFRLFSPRHDGPDESSLLEPGRSLPEVSRHFHCIRHCFLHFLCCTAPISSSPTDSIMYACGSYLNRSLTSQYGFSSTAFIATHTSQCTCCVMATRG